MCNSQCQGHTQYSNSISMVSTCPSSVAFGQDIADQGVRTRTLQAMVNSLEYATLEGHARSKYADDINMALSDSISGMRSS